MSVTAGRSTAGHLVRLGLNISEGTMLNRSIRRVALTAITLASVTVLTGLYATGASASLAGAASHRAAAFSGTVDSTTPNTSSAPDSTNPICNKSDLPWPCIQVYGSGLFVATEYGWAYNESAAAIGGLHIELYYDPAKYGIQPPGSDDSFFMVNCPIGTLAGHSNGPAAPGCSMPGTITFYENVYLCSAVWQYLGGTVYKDLGYSCAFVHSA